MANYVLFFFVCFFVFVFLFFGGCVGGLSATPTPLVLSAHRSTTAPAAAVTREDTATRGLPPLTRRVCQVGGVIVGVGLETEAIRVGRVPQVVVAAAAVRTSTDARWGGGYFERNRRGFFFAFFLVLINI